MQTLTVELTVEMEVTDELYERIMEDDGYEGTENILSPLLDAISNAQSEDYVEVSAMINMVESG